MDAGRIVREILADAYGKDFNSDGAFIGSGMQVIELIRLYEIASALPPGSTALEVGMASGTSSVILASVCRRLVSVDPYQHTPAYDGSGVEALRRLGLDAVHELREKPDYQALPELAAEGHSFALVLVDGWHSLDHTMLNAFYADLMLEVGGVLVLHDTWSPPVYDCCKFLSRHKPYAPMSPPPVRHAGLPVRLWRRLTGVRPGRSGWGTLAAYRKLADRQAEQWPHETLFDHPGALGIAQHRG